MKIKEKIISNDWIWFWSGNWTLLDNFYQRDPLFQKEFKNLLGDYPRKTLDFYRDGIVTAYHAKEEYDRLEKSFKRRFDDDPEFIIKIYKGYKKKTDFDLNNLKKIGSLNHSYLSNNELLKLFKRSRKYFAYNGAIDHFCWYFEKFFIPVLERFLYTKKDTFDMDISDALFILLLPKKESRLSKERKSFLDILRKIIDNNKIEDFLHGEEIAFIEEDIKKHIKRFSYIQVLVNNPPLTKKQVLEELKEKLASQNGFDDTSIRLGDKVSERDLEKKESLMKLLNPSKKMRFLIESLSQTAFIRTEDNMITGLSTYHILPLQKEICKRIGVNYKAYKQLTPEEVVFYLRHHIKVPTSLINERLKLAVYYFHESEGYLLPYGMGVEILKKLSLSNDDSESIHGSIASKGEVTGRAFVVKSSLSDMSDFKKGDILVAPATSADFVPYMRKASAVITEMGGLTSHAAIVSRELGIPCLVGVKGATIKIISGDGIEIKKDGEIELR